MGGGGAAASLEGGVGVRADVGQRPAATLAQVAWPVRAWGGEQDTGLSSLVSPDDLGRDLASLGIDYTVVPRLDHTGMLDRLDLILPSIASWLADQSSGCN